MPWLAFALNGFDNSKTLDIFSAAILYIIMLPVFLASQFAAWTPSVIKFYSETNKINIARKDIHSVIREMVTKEVKLGLLKKLPEGDIRVEQTITRWAQKKEFRHRFGQQLEQTKKLTSAQKYLQNLYAVLEHAQAYP